MLMKLKMQQRSRSAPSDTETTPVEACPSCGQAYADEGSFIGRYWTGAVTTFHCWCSGCGFTCDVTPGPADNDAGDAVALADSPVSRCPSCRQQLGDSGGTVSRLLVEDLQTSYVCSCGSCGFTGAITPVERVLAHEAAD